MSSVTQRINTIKQPKGGYIPPKEFEISKKSDNEVLKGENIPANMVGLVVDYMTRFQLGTPAKEAFKISLLGAGRINQANNANMLLKNINELDNNSIISACKLVGYDTCFRAGIETYKPVEQINPDQNTIDNIKTMIKRSVTFFKQNGPVIKDGFTFEGGYTDVISRGDGDFLTEDTLWDLKVLSGNITSKNTLQLLIYYVMGKHSINSEFNNIKYLGIFNPRKNMIYKKRISDISNNIIKTIEDNVICYNKTNLVDEKLDMSDIMKLLGCSRHMVMKYYTQYDLPLYKENNKYYMNMSDYEIYRENRLRLSEQTKKEDLILAIIALVILVSVAIFCFNKIFFEGV